MNAPEASGFTPVAGPQIGMPLGFNDGDDDGDTIDNVGIRGMALELAHETAKLSQIITTGYWHPSDLAKVVIDSAKVYEAYLLGDDLPK
jgi:hypothetical protein